MANDLVLITGGSGHIGFKTLVVALEHGYRVRAVVRSDAKAQLILAAPSIKRINPGDRLTFSIVSDFLAPSAFATALAGVDYAIHLASPIAGGNIIDHEAQLIQPAVHGTLSFLEAAKQTPSIKRVVITSSVAAIISWSQLHKEVSLTPSTETSRTPDPHPPYADGEFEAYCASKVRALNASEAWMSSHSPHFSLVHIHPGFVIGPDELVTSAADFARGTNIIALSNVLGNNGGSFSSSAVHLDDVARAHVEALDSRVPDGQSLLLTSEGTQGNTYDDALEVVAERFPKAVAKGVLPNTGKTNTHRTPFDKSRTLEILGWEFKSFKEAVVDVAKNYLELRGEELA